MEHQGIPWSNLVSVAIWLIVLVLITAIFVAAEYGFLLVRKTRIQELAEQGNAAAKTVLKVMDDPQAFLAGVQVGITVTSLALGAFTEEPLTEFFVALLGASNQAWLQPAALAIGTVVSLAVASYFHVVLGELVPRALTLQIAERIALLFVPPLAVFTRLMRPFIWLLKSSSSLVLRVFGIDAADTHGQLHSADEIRMLVEQSEAGGLIESEQSEMLGNVFSFGDTTVREVMVPRPEMACVDVTASLHSVAHVFSARAYSLLPVYDETPDKIVGVLHSKDMMRALLSADRTRQPTVRQMMREPYFVPDSQRADELLADFRKRREYMAIVLDEYGGTAGLVTLNDLVTRIIGEIEDSGQTASPDIVRGADGSAAINGMTTIGDLNDAFGLNLVDENYDTVGGYVMGRLGRIPREGDVVDVPGGAGVAMQLRVEEMDKLRVAKLRLRRAVKSEAATA